MSHYNVVIATPGINFAAEYVRSLMETAQVLQENNITFKFLNGYSSIVSDAREMTALNAKDITYEDSLVMNGEHTYDKIFWIDSDMLWTPKYFLDLYHSDKDAIAGVYVNTKIEPLFYFNDPEKDELEYRLKMLKESTEPFKVFAVGFGFICLKAGVMERLDRPWFEFGAFMKPDRNGVDRRTIIGEDIMFCYKLDEAKIDLYVDPNVRCGHMKMKALGISK